MILRLYAGCSTPMCLPQMHMQMYSLHATQNIAVIHIIHLHTQFFSYSTCIIRRLILVPCDTFFLRAVLRHHARHMSVPPIHDKNQVCCVFQPLSKPLCPKCFACVYPCFTVIASIKVAAANPPPVVSVLFSERGASTTRSVLQTAAQSACRYSLAPFVYVLCAGLCRRQAVGGKHHVWHTPAPQILDYCSRPPYIPRLCPARSVC